MFNYKVSPLLFYQIHLPIKFCRRAPLLCRELLSANTLFAESKRNSSRQRPFYSAKTGFAVVVQSEGCSRDGHLLPPAAAASRKHRDALLPRRGGAGHPPARRRREGPVHERGADDVIAAFNIVPGSTEAKQVRHTLSRCQAPPIAGEVKSCTASLEATVESAMRMLGAGGGDVWAAASELPRAGLPQQTYAVVAATQVQGDEYLSCHTLPFPYAVYQCHVAPMAYWAYKVSLAGLRDGSAVALLAICHLDTSGWNPAQPAFEVLQTKPGGWPVCHFMPYGNLAFVKTMATTA
ncbi:hypothetical protein EJB05_53497, partial [Eragrostis curvula]